MKEQKLKKIRKNHVGKETQRKWKFRGKDKQWRKNEQWRRWTSTNRTAENKRTCGDWKTGLRFRPVVATNGWMS